MKYKMYLLEPNITRRRNRFDFYTCVATRPNPIEKIMSSSHDATRAIYCELGFRESETFKDIKIKVTIYIKIVIILKDY